MDVNTSLRNLWLLLSVLAPLSATAASLSPIPQKFRQELSSSYPLLEGDRILSPQLIDSTPDGTLRVLAGGRWQEFRNGRFAQVTGLPESPSRLVFWDLRGRVQQVDLPPSDIRQILRHKEETWLITETEPYLFRDGKLSTTEWARDSKIRQANVSKDGVLHVASSRGVFRRKDLGWEKLEALDSLGRSWGTHDVLALTFDSMHQLWFATKAGVAVQRTAGWSFIEPKDGLPYNAFTCLAAGPEGEVWMGTTLGVIRHSESEFHYRQGPGWMPDDAVHQIHMDPTGGAWIATAKGLAHIHRESMTLREKALRYEEEIERYIKRTPFGFTAQAFLTRPTDRSSASTQDDDNDGLWTAMYGAGECFAYGATQDPQAKARAKQVFEALRFLQKVTQGGPHSPPKGFVARSIRSVELPDPNAGQLESDKRSLTHDALWKVYEPRWPKSADGKWYWKSDTSSDELDGHYFFYGLYYDLCADNPEEKARVREVVKDLTDHLVSHDYLLVDHDGKPTRWGVFGPRQLNMDPRWWPERGLNSLSMLSYLAVAAHVTGETSYEDAQRDLVEKHGYAHNLMFAKLQRGPGSGNQSDDEMAFMSYYTLLRYTRNETLQKMARYSFFEYWVNEFPEMNPFFNFSYAALGRGQTTENPFGRFSLEPWAGWLEDSRATLYGFPIDRIGWAHKNSHRLDITFLEAHSAIDLYSKDRRERGHRIGGKVLPVENRHFGHWNTDPWTLDYGGQGAELSSGTVYLLPYYMGLYHGFIEKP